MLFTTKTCPNCKAAKAVLDKSGIGYTVIDAEESVDMTKDFGVRQAPTLIVKSGDAFDRFAGVLEIRRYIESTR